MSTGTLLERRFRVLGRNSPLFYERPLQLVRGEGVWVYDADGRRYLVNYAERLLQTYKAPLERVFFTCTGSESNELALRIARECTGHMGVISTAFAYHGNTAAVAEISSVFTSEAKRGPFVRCIPVIDPYRERNGRSDAELVAVYIRDLQTAIDDLARNGVKLAAVLFCTAFSSEGLPDIPAGYFPEVARVVRDAGGLVIADEVQAGFGRFGSHMWGHEMHGLVPDIVTMGKPMGNGHPLAGVVTTADLMDRFTSRNMYFNTFGGNEVSCATGLAVLEVLKEDRLLENARRVGDYVVAGMRELQKKHAIIGDVRGKGLFFAVELVRDRATRAPAGAQTKSVVNAMRERGVLISRIGPHDNILKIRPPMCFSTDNADLLLGTLDSVLAGVN
jgi:4-aminobutyrate aminotransferase-like enzyme